jgi:hypothetical protein
LLIGVPDSIGVGPTSDSVATPRRRKSLRSAIAASYCASGSALRRGRIRATMSLAS